MIELELRNDVYRRPLVTALDRLGQFLKLAEREQLYLDLPGLGSYQMPTLAFSHDHAPQRTRQLDIDGQKVPYNNQKAWIGVATLTGLPATVAPIGHSESGLPIGVQIVGGYLDDRTTIAFAGMIEREFGGFVPPPLD